MDLERTGVGGWGGTEAEVEEFRMVIFAKWPARSTCSIFIGQTGSVYTERQQKTFM